MEKNVYRGEIYFANLSGAIGSEQKGFRPVVIVQNNVGNNYSPTVIAVPLTKICTSIDTQPTHIEIEKFNLLKYDSTILAEQIRTLDKSRLGDKIGQLPFYIMKKLDKGMLIAQGLH